MEKTDPAFDSLRVIQPELSPDSRERLHSLLELKAKYDQALMGDKISMDSHEAILRNIKVLEEKLKAEGFPVKTSYLWHLCIGSGISNIDTPPFLDTHDSDIENFFREEWEGALAKIEEK